MAATPSNTSDDPYRSSPSNTSNAAQVEQWEGVEGAHWVEYQARWDALLAPLSDALLRAAAIAPGEHVLDVGCGCGASTIEAARAARPGDVVGVDLSQPMLARAGERAAAAGVGNVRFEQADAQVHPFPPGAFDVVISRFGVMYFEDPVAAFTNIASAVRPGGRMAFVCFQDPIRNGWVTVPAVAVIGHLGRPRNDLPDKGPFSFRDRDLVEKTLAAAGFVDVTTTAVHHQVTLGDTVDDACRFVADNSVHRPFFEGASDAARTAALGAVRSALERHVTPGGVMASAAAWLVTATRP